MKIRSFLMAMLAATALFSACNKTEDLGVAKIVVDPTSLSFDKTYDTQEVSLTATRDWMLSSKPEWVALDVTEGKASASAQTIKVSVLDNDGNDRSGNVVFSIGLMKATLTISQKGSQGAYVVEEGDGSKDKPFTIAQAFDAVKDLSWTDKDNYESVGPYYVKGKVVSIKSNFDAESNGTYYGNAEFVLSDDGTTDGAQFTCYRIKYFENKAWKQGQSPVLAVGDVVVFYGKLMYYGSGESGKTRLAETVNNTAYLISINGVTSPDGGGQDDISKYTNAPATTVADFIAKADKNTIYKLTGTVTGSINTQYGNFYLEDATGKVQIYGCTNWSDFKDKVKQGSTVTVAGPYEEFNGSPEMKNGYILSAEGGQEVDYNNAPAKTVAEFLAAADTENYYKLSGTVSKFNSQYSSFDLTDATGTIYVYSVANKADWSGKILDGATVTLAGQYKLYNDTPEVVNAYILSAEGGQQVDYNSAPAKTVAEFLAAADTENYYKLSGEVSNFDAGYSSFDLTDATGTIYVYSVANKADWSGKIGDGTQVTLAGKYKLYNDTPEVVNAYILSAEGGDIAPEVDGITLSFPDDNQASNSVSSYADDWTAKKGSYSWTISCFNNNKWGNSWTYIKCGSKKADSVASIATDQALDKAVEKVVVTVDKVSETGKINSTKLVVASDAAFTAVIEEVPVALTKAGAIEYPVSAPAAGLYYKLVYDLAQSSNNGIIQISKVVYATAE